MRFFLILSGIVLLITAPSSAQTMDMADAQTVAIAFYKFAGLQPGFLSWAEDTEAFQKAPLARRDRVQREEAERLARAYEAFSRSGDLLNVATMVELDIEEIIDEADALKKSYVLHWRFVKGDATFFPYEYRDTLFALVPDRLEAFQRAPISEAQYAYLVERLRGDKRARLIVQLRGHYADPDKPVHLRGEEFWALAARVAGVSLWDRKGTLLWENTADWYVSPRTQSLNRLYYKKEAR